MTCPKWEKKQFLYISGEMSQKDRQDFEEHLKTCKDCQENLGWIQSTFNHIESIPELKPGRQLKQSILSEAGKQIRKKHKRAWFPEIEKWILPRKVTVAISFALVVIISLTVFQAFRNQMVQPEDDILAWEDDFLAEVSYLDEEINRVESGRLLADIPEMSSSNQEGWLSPMSEDILDLKENVQDIMSTLYGI